MLMYNVDSHMRDIITKRAYTCFNYINMLLSIINIYIYMLTYSVG